MTKKRAYVETSVISYLTARPASNALKRAHQLLTETWWKRRSNWNCFVTTTVMEEISRGNPEAAMKRREKAVLLPEWPIASDASALAALLVERKLVPESSITDALHLALAAFYQADYLLTWNQTHLDNLDLRFRIEELIRGWGLTPAKVITPERLLEESL
jgi:predicted nucleic acid-binding protein